MDMYKKASKLKLRFETLKKGQITVEDLWDLPLTSANGVSLDGIAIKVNRDLKGSEEESFVAAASKASSELQLKLNILKDVIATKQDEKTKAKSVVESKAKREKILNIIAKKQNDSLENMSEEDLQKLLNETS